MLHSFLQYIPWLLIQLFVSALSTLYTSELSIGLIEQPTTFQPHSISNESDRFISNLLYRKLFKYEGEALVPDLISSWESNDSYKEFKFKLKENQHWQDGHPITTEDIIYTISRYDALINNMDIEKVTDLEVTINLNTPIAILPELLTIPLQPAHLQQKNETTKVGSTSYYVTKIKQEKRKTKQIIFTSFVKYKPFNKIILKFYDNESDLKNAYKLGEINTFFSDTRFNWNFVSQNNVQYVGRYFVLIFNSNNTKLKDINIRRKLSQALNVESLLQKTFYENATIAQGPISNSAYTIEKFKKHDFRPKVNLSINERDIVNELMVILPKNPTGRQIEAFLRQSWETTFDIKLVFEYHDEETLIEQAANSQFDVLLLGHETTPDPDRYAFWHSSQSDRSGINFGNFADPRADKALEEGRITTDSDERIKHYNIFQDAILSKTPAVFLYHPGQFLYINPKISERFLYPTKLYYPSDILKNL